MIKQLFPNLWLCDLSQTSLLSYVRSLKLTDKQEKELFDEILKFYRSHIESHNTSIDFVHSLIPKE